MGNVDAVESILRQHKHTRETSETIVGLTGIIAVISGSSEPVIQISMGPHQQGLTPMEVEASYEKASALMSTMAQYLKHEDFEGALTSFQQSVEGLTTTDKQTFFRSCFHVAGITIQQLASNLEIKGDENE